MDHGSGRVHCNPASLIEAMEKGDFYATTGVELNEMNFTNNQLSISVKPQSGVNYTIQFWGARRKIIMQVNY